MSWAKEERRMKKKRSVECAREMVWSNKWEARAKDYIVWKLIFFHYFSISPINNGTFFMQNIYRTVHMLYRLWCITLACVLFYINASFGSRIRVFFLLFHRYFSMCHWVFVSFFKAFFSSVKQGKMLHCCYRTVASLKLLIIILLFSEIVFFSFCYCLYVHHVWLGLLSY